MQAWFRETPGTFPAGTDRSDTRALTAIWTDCAGFDRAAAEILPRLAALPAAAESGQSARFAQALQETGAGCGNCHRSLLPGTVPPAVLTRLRRGRPRPGPASSSPLRPPAKARGDLVGI